MVAPNPQWDRTRWYEIDGKRLVSVTSVLDIISKPALAGWFAKQERLAFEAAMKKVLAVEREQPLTPEAALAEVQEAATGIKAGERARRFAADLGKRIHAAVEYELKRRLGRQEGEPPRLEGAAAAAYAEWLAWFDARQIVPLAVEQTVYCLGCGYAGTLDLYAEREGKRYVLDWKTGAAIYPEAYLQNIAYRHAAATLGIPSDGGVIVRLPKSSRGKVATKIVPPETAHTDFLAALRLWRWRRRVEGLEVGTFGTDDKEEPHEVGLDVSCV